MENWGAIYLPLLVVLLLLIVWFLSKRNAELRKRQEEERRQLEAERLRVRTEDLTQRFGADLAEVIINGQIQQGMTSEHLLESWGAPADVDQKVFKTKIKETWKYGEIGKNRYRNRVFLENEIIVGWDTK